MQNRNFIPHLLNFGRWTESLGCSHARFFPLLLHIIHFSSAVIIRSMKEHRSSREGRSSAIRCRSCSWLGDKLRGIHVDHLFLYPRSDNRLRMIFFEQFRNLAKFLDVLYGFFLTSSTKSSTIGSRLRLCQTFLGASQVPFFFFFRNQRYTGYLLTFFSGNVELISTSASVTEKSCACKNFINVTDSLKIKFHWPRENRWI